MKIILLNLITLLVLASAYAKDTTYYLNNYGDTISKVLIENSIAQNKNDQSTIKKVLDYNNLTWIDARYLSVGFKFYVEGVDEDSVVIVDVNGFKYRVEIGMFHHSISRGSTEVYSNLSHYVLLNANYNELYLNLRADNTVYSKDDDQNISNDSSELMFDLALGKILAMGKFEVGLGAFYKRILTYQIDSINEVIFDYENALGLNIFVRRDFVFTSSYSVIPELSISRQLNNKAVYELTSLEFSLINKVALLGSKLDIALRYEYSSFSISDRPLSSKKASFGIGYNF